MNQPFKTCAQCGARNKLTWEFCARCGEALEGQAVAAADEFEYEPDADAEADEVEDTYVDDTSGGGFRLRDAGMAVLLLAAGVASWKWLQNAPVPAAPAGAFVTAATLPPPQVRPVRAAYQTAGQADYERGRVLLARRDFAGAIEALSKAITDAPDNARFRALYAQALSAGGAAEDGLREYEAAVRMDPANGALAAEYARMLNRAGRAADAVSAYEAALVLSPEDAGLLRELGALYVQAGQADRAAEMLGRVARLRGHDLVVQQEHARALEAARRTDEAALVYAQILERMPQAHLTRGLYAEMLFTQGRPDDAIGLFRAGLERDPAAALLHRGLGSVLERAGRPAEASAAYLEYARLAPGAADAAQLTERANLLKTRVAAR